MAARRVLRWLQWHLDGKRYAHRSLDHELDHVVFRHRSKLVKKLGDSDIKYQYNKVENLRIAAARLSGMIIRPGETLSFCRSVGRPTRSKGYLPGMELSDGKASVGIGGGICALSNLIHWMVLHSALEVTERHRHGFDPFPDDDRVLPFACGATVFYNYKDLQVHNPTGETYQLLLWLSEHYLEGELRVDGPVDVVFEVEERNHRFVRRNGRFFRANELWQIRMSGSDRRVLDERMVLDNFALVMYQPRPEDLVEYDEDTG